jgi:hypothetical protein
VELPTSYNAITNSEYKALNGRMSDSVCNGPKIISKEVVVATSGSMVYGVLQDALNVAGYIQSNVKISPE